MLAPPGGEDANTLSLVSQLLSLGVAFELDENWRLPTRPPRDLSQYKACLFPETARAEYDRELNAFYQDGGHLSGFKYYPVSPPGEPESYLVRQARDAHFYNVANMILQGGLRCDHPDFARTLQRRTTASMTAECRQSFFNSYGERDPNARISYGDTTYTQLLAHQMLAEREGMKSGKAWWSTACDKWPPARMRRCAKWTLGRALCPEWFPRLSHSAARC